MDLRRQAAAASESNAGQKKAVCFPVLAPLPSARAGPFAAEGARRFASLSLAPVPLPSILAMPRALSFPGERNRGERVRYAARSSGCDAGRPCWTLALEKLKESLTERAIG
eukprot:622009-Pleurochrysis_carterae.AAC.1